MHLYVANVVSSSAVLWHAGSIPGNSCVNDRNLSRQVSLHVVPGGGGGRDGGSHISKVLLTGGAAWLIRYLGTI